MIINRLMHNFFYCLKKLFKDLIFVLKSFFHKVTFEVKVLKMMKNMIFLNKKLLFLNKN